MVLLISSLEEEGQRRCPGSRRAPECHLQEGTVGCTLVVQVVPWSRLSTGDVRGAHVLPLLLHWACGLEPPEAQFWHHFVLKHCWFWGNVLLADCDR